MNRRIHFWKLRSVELQLGDKTAIMGVLNVTPDSFSDGGRYSDPDAAYARALELEEQGADIIDIGAESTKPGSQRISAEEEWRRLVPVLKRLRDKLTIPISLDTYKSEIAERAFEYGVEIINDPSGLTFDPDLAKAVANANAGLILNHMRGTPETWAKLPPLPDIMSVVTRDLEATVNRARRAGVEHNRIAVDPGLGFGKRREQNSEILAQLRQLAPLECPVMVGPSRKSFLAQATPGETQYATAGAVAAAILNGAHIVRVHDIREMRAVAQVVDEVLRASAAKQAAEAQAERPVPRRTAPPREIEERPRAVKPPVIRKPEPEPEVEAESAPQRDFSERPPKRDFGDRPPKRDFGDRPPKRDFGDRPPKRDFGDRPPKRDFGDRPPKRDFGDRPPKRDFGDRPPRKSFGDRPARKEFGDRPPRRDFGDRPPRKSFGDRPPRKDFGDRPPKRDFGDRPPRRDFSPRPPRGKGPGGPEGPGGHPPKRPFRKRP
ncbi:MAG TPA: dihydropteroate synthase [Bryobacteraceae bacterium]|nr:dihydropteroate synthase [Bryobacteraceae bacterium]